MARKTDGEKIDELSGTVTTLVERFDNLRRELDTLTPRVLEVERTLGEFKTRVALLEHQTASLNQAQEKWGQRLWLLLAPLVGAVVGSLLTYYLHAGK